MEQVFDFERLVVYQLARELNREITGILAELPRGAGEAGDNLRRAGASIVRNLAEASGKWTVPDKVARLHIARGSSMEVGASLDELVDYGFLPSSRARKATTLAWRITSMLMGVIRSLNALIEEP